MKAVILKDYEGGPQSLMMAKLPVPTLKHGQVLVKMAAAPINPSDLVFLKGQYGITKPLPVVPGFEGSGTVVATGGGWWGRWLMGKRVACKAPEDGNGTWAEYMAASSDACIPLFDYITLEWGASLIVNPLTAYALVQQARTQGHTSFVQTAAASALGVMIARLAIRYRMTGIHIVRRAEQVKRLKELGCDYVFDSSDDLFSERLGEACYKFKTTLAFDAVGGELTQRLAACMPPSVRIVVYGALSGENCQIRPQDLIYNDEKLEGFWLSQWIKSKSPLQKLLFANRVQRLLTRELSTTIQARFPLDQFDQAIALYKKQRTLGKVLLVSSPGN